MISKRRNRHYPRNNSWLSFLWFYLQFLQWKFIFKHLLFGKWICLEFIQSLTVRLTAYRMLRYCLAIYCWMDLLYCLIQSIILSLCTSYRLSVTRTYPIVIPDTCTLSWFLRFLTIILILIFLDDNWFWCFMLMYRQPKRRSSSPNFKSMILISFFLQIA